MNEANDLMQLLGVVEHICTKLVKEHPTGFYYSYVRNGDAAASQIGAQTYQISARLGLDPDKTRYRLNKLEKSGKLLAHRHRAHGVISWWPVGLSEKLNA